MASKLEKEFVLEALAEGIRVDGRKLNQLREVELEFGAEYGNVEVRLGKTRLAVQVSATVTKPRASRPFEGQFLITTDITSMAHPKFENGRQSMEEVLLARLVEKAIKRSNALDLESLCIVAGKSCWLVRADVHYLDYDAGLTDATCIGVAAALLHFRRPDTSIDGDRVVIHPVADRPPVPLAVLHVPICVTWAIFSEGTLVLDATAAEHEVKLGELTITMNKDREICQLSKNGGLPLPSSKILQCGDHAHRVARKTTEYIYERLKEDFAARNAGNLGLDLAANDR